jgi:hypothetical protein
MGVPLTVLKPAYCGGNALEHRVHLRWKLILWCLLRVRPRVWKLVLKVGLIMAWRCLMHVCTLPLITILHLRSHMRRKG